MGELCNVSVTQITFGREWLQHVNTVYYSGLF